MNLNSIRINAPRTMILEDSASFPDKIGVIFKPDSTQRAIVSSIDSRAFLFLTAYRTYMGGTRDHLYAFLNPRFFD